MNQLVPARAQSSTTPTATLQTALRLFEEQLTREQKQYLHQSGRVSDPSDVVVFIAEIDAANQSSRRSSSSRLFTFLDTAQQFVGVVDTFVSSNPSIAALVWGGIKTSIVIANNNLPYFEKVTAMITTIGQWSPTYAQFNQLYQDDPQVQGSLCDYYAVVVRICTRIVQVHSRSTDLLSRLTTSFEMEFKPLLDELDRAQKRLHLQFHLASHKLGCQSAEIVAKERDANKTYRRLVSSFQSSSLHKQAKLSESIALQYRQQILDNLSKIKSRQIWSAIHAQRVIGTAEWFKQDQSFQVWFQAAQSSVLCCSGTLGVGKSVLVSSIIAYLEQNRDPKHDFSYHFCQANYGDTLYARSVLGNIARQLLTRSIRNLRPDHLPELLEKSRDANVEDLTAMLERYLEKGIARSYFIILDGLDECSEDDAVVILSQIERLSRNQKFCIKTLYSCRPDVETMISKWIKHDMRLEVSHDNLQEDIQKFIEAIVQQRISEERLLVKDPKLCHKIVEVLATECDGMFLWLSLFMDELCFQNSDADILETLKRPPKGITELYNRKLVRIRSHRSVAESIAILRYTGVALRPLSIEEMRQILGVSLSQQEFDPSRLPNDMGRIIRACGGLVHVDEGTSTLQYVHSSLLTHLFLDSQKVEGFHYLETQIYFSSLCMTFLNFENFAQRISPISEERDQFKPIDVALAQFWPSTTHKPRLTRKLLQFRDSRASANSQRLSSLGSPSAADQTVLSVFFEYASEYWLQHTKHLGPTEDSGFWEVLHRCIANQHLNKWKPWLNIGHDQVYRSDGAKDMIQWAFINKHTAILFYQIRRQAILVNVALLRLSISNAAPHEDIAFTTAIVQHFLQDKDLRRHVLHELLAAASGGNTQILQLLIIAGAEINFVDATGLHTPLSVAIQNGHVDTVKLLLTAGADVDITVGSHEQSLLHMAIPNGHFEIAKLLIGAGADVNTADSYNETPLYKAVLRENTEMVKLLIGAGADVNIATQQQGIPILAAVQREHTEIVRLLLEAGADINVATQKQETPMLAAVNRGRVKVVKLLLEAGADVNVVTQEQETPIYTAAFRGYTKIIKLLLEAGADVDIATQRQETPILVAVHQGHTEVVELLLEAGADVNVTTQKQETPILVAVHRGHVGVVKLLLDAGADVNVATQKQETPIYTAALRGDTKIMKLLLEAGANVNVATRKQETPILVAVHRGHIEVVKLLLKAGADVNVASQKQETPILVATLQENLEMIELLSRAGAKPAKFDTTYREGTLLHDAITHGQIRTVQLCLTAGANVNATTTFSETPLYKAVWMGHVELVKLLLEAGADVDATSYGHETPLFNALVQGHLDIARLLLAANADASIANFNNRRPMDIARSKSEWDMVRLIEQHLSSSQTQLE